MSLVAARLCGATLFRESMVGRVIELTSSQMVVFRTVCPGCRVRARWVRCNRPPNRERSVAHRAAKASRATVQCESKRVARRGPPGFAPVIVPAAGLRFLTGLVQGPQEIALLDDTHRSAGTPFFDHWERPEVRISENL